MVEINSTVPTTIGNVLGSGDTFQKISDQTGNNTHLRVETTMPAVYIAPGEGGKWGFAFALMNSLQADIAPRQDYSFNTQAVEDIGPAITVGRKLLDDDALSVGATAHATYRLSTRQAVSLTDIIAGKSLSGNNLAGDGAMIDFDLGAQYMTPVQFDDFHLLAGVSINNLLGGNYANLGFHPVGYANVVLTQPRAANIGAGLQRKVLGPFSDFVATLESTDLGNNSNGSFYRTLHIGAEGRFGHLLPRVGINQGYLTAGFGFDTRFFEFELATYGEELSLNVGSQRLEDRRYALRIALQI